MEIKLNKDKIYYSIKITIVIIISTIIFLFLNKQFSFYIPCIFHKITNLWCPGCGITRMIISIINLNFYQAFRYNPLAFILLPFFIIYGLIYYFNWIQDKHFQINKNIWYILLIITLLFMVLRNISIFDFLAPTKIK